MTVNIAEGALKAPGAWMEVYAICNNQGVQLRKEFMRLLASMVLSWLLDLFNNRCHFVFAEL